jgi:hypothetical protein
MGVTSILNLQKRPLVRSLARVKLGKGVRTGGSLTLVPPFVASSLRRSVAFIFNFIIDLAAP